MKTEIKLKELEAKQRDTKRRLIDLMEKASNPNITKEFMRDQMFKIYMVIK